ncbi:hypothetical protein [Erythrobacter sp. NAP1]|uniref:hypothetical protein n=1 Tax=Erythrobacter sp. NAP1 TaxID=237727 RepID=UPI001F51614E|nr:hypothetical protein [Erythrobacter sp. NAP1]
MHTVGAIALTFGIAACVPSAEPPPPPPPPPAPVSTPSPTPTPTPTPPPFVQEPQYDNYLDAPQTQGMWSYVDEPGESLAIFTEGSGEPVFIVRCAAGIVALGRPTGNVSPQPRAMSVTTETTTRQLVAQPIPDSGLVAVGLQPRDPLLDAMAITKGRFAIGTEGERTLYLPAWAEVTRVIEDCR